MNKEIYISQINNSTASILRFLENCSEEKTLIRPEGKWSIKDNLEHLVLFERIVLVLLQRSSKVLSRNDEYFGYERLKEILIDERTVNRVNAPANVQPKGKFTSSDEAADALIAQREKLKALISEDKITSYNAVIPHPYLGDMTAGDWLNLVPLHAERHLAQMIELLN